MAKRKQEGWSERATTWTVGAPLVLFDRVRERARRMLSGTRERAEDVASEARGYAREALREADLAGEADRRPYEQRTLDELYDLAQQHGIEGRSHMGKEELIDALRRSR